MKVIKDLGFRDGTRINISTVGNDSTPELGNTFPTTYLVHGNFACKMLINGEYVPFGSFGNQVL